MEIALVAAIVMAACFVVMAALAYQNQAIINRYETLLTKHGIPHSRDPAADDRKKREGCRW